MTTSSDLGTVEHDGEQTILRFERRLAHPIERVWRALTDPAELLGWWGRVALELGVGGSFDVTWLNLHDDQGNAVEPFTMHAQITALEPPHLLEVSGDLHGVLRFELQGDGDATLLRFSATAELPAEHRARSLAGWHVHLDALCDVLDGRSVDLVNLPQFEQVRTFYGA
jgi:uncharacterized protein YndB with AHSA1/START domain